MRPHFFVEILISYFFDEFFSKVKLVRFFSLKLHQKIIHQKNDQQLFVRTIFYFHHKNFTPFIINILFFILY